MQPDPDISTGITQLTYSATVVWFLQKLKSCRRLPWINNNSDQVNRTLGILFSGLTAIGVHWTVSGSVIDGSTIVIAIPSGAVLLSGFIHWFQSFILQETVYQAVIKPKEKAEQVVVATNRVEAAAQIVAEAVRMPGV